MGKTLAQMTEEIREVNVEKGWRSAEGGPCVGQTFGDYVALLHSEVSEALEAYRDHRLEDATGPNYREAMNPNLPEIAKPEGVGSEFADVLIRLLDMCDVFGIVVFDTDMELADVTDDLMTPFGGLESFGDHLSLLHFYISLAWLPPGNEWPHVLRGLVTTARKFGIDLTAEYERKIAYNRTRAFQHGGRTLA